MYNSKVYEPNRDVMDSIRSPKKDVDRRLSKIWEHIGAKVKVEMDNVGDQSGNIQKDIIDTFSISDWAYELMIEFLKFNPYAEEIRIIPRYLRSTPLQFSANFFSMFTGEPVLFIKPGCNFVGALAENPENKNITNFYFWKFEQYEPEQSSVWINEQFQKHFSRNISIDTANCIDRRTEIHEKAKEMFSTDPIASKLKGEILRYNPSLHTVDIQLCFTRGIKGKQCLNDIWMTLANFKEQKPILIVEKGSKFAAVITKKSSTDSVLNLYMWDLENSF